MYTPSRVIIYDEYAFHPPSDARAHMITVDVTGQGYPAEAVAVEVLLGCRSWADGAYVSAYDGLEPVTETIAVYPVSPMRNQWAFGRGRVELDASRFMLRVRPNIEDLEVIVVLKGYYTA